jgi:hypothetical protein
MDGAIIGAMQPRNAIVVRGLLASARNETAPMLAALTAVAGHASVSGARPPLT